MIATWLFWFVFVAQAFIGSLITFAVGFFVHMRASGKLGGGKTVWNLSALPEGEVSTFFLQKQGHLYKTPAGGDMVVIRKVHGLFGGFSDEKIVDDDLIALDKNHFIYGRKGLSLAIGKHIDAKSKEIAMLRNAMAMAVRKIKNEEFDRAALIDDLVKVMDKASSAVIFNSGRSKK